MHNSKSVAASTESAYYEAEGTESCCCLSLSGIYQVYELRSSFQGLCCQN